MSTLETAPATPAERRHLKVRRSILEAAERVFAHEGESGLSIRRLADEIDYSPAAIYKYFGSKAELVDELKEAFFAEILSRAHNVYEAYPDPRVRGRACLTTYVAMAIERPHHYAAAFTGVVEDDPNMAAHTVESFAQTRKHQAFRVIESMVEDGIAAGVMRPEIDPSLAARSLWASCHGLALLMCHMPRFPSFTGDASVADREAFIAYHADQLLRGLELPEAMQ